MDENIGRDGKADSKYLQVVMAMRNKLHFATGPQKIPEITWYQ